MLYEVFDTWNRGELRSYLLEITARIVAFPDDRGTGDALLDRIDDRAGQKGTGRWTTQAALELGVPIPTITAAVDARLLSALQGERQKAAEVYRGTGGAGSGEAPDPRFAAPFPVNGDARGNLVEGVRRARFTATAEGAIKWRGKEALVELKGQGKLDGVSVQATAMFDFDIKRLGLSAPRFLMIKMEDEVSIEVTIQGPVVA